MELNVNKINKELNLEYMICGDTINILGPYNILSTSHVSIPKTIDNLPVTSIEAFSFMDMGVEDVVIDAECKIGNRAFSGNKIKIVNIDTDLYVGYGAFSNNEITDLNISNDVSVTFLNSSFSRNRLSELDIHRNCILHNDSFAYNNIKNINYHGTYDHKNIFSLGAFSNNENIKFMEVNHGFHEKRKKRLKCVNGEIYTIHHKADCSYDGYIIHRFTRSLYYFNDMPISYIAYKDGVYSSPFLEVEEAIDDCNHKIIVKNS